MPRTLPSPDVAVEVTSEHEELSLQEAADFLDISTESLAHLIDSGQILYTRASMNRKVSSESVMRYKRASDAESLAILDDLVAYDQELGI